MLFITCLWHAAQQDRFYVVELLWSGFYGFLLEWITLKQLGAYRYGQFLIMIDGAPVAIGLGWAVIIYASMRFSNQLQLPEAVRPLLDALMALNIDIALDTIAVRLGMWTWTGVALDQQWFGVPWANFWAWFIVVWSYSGFIRALRTWKDLPLRRWLYAPLAVFLSLLVLSMASELYRFMSYNAGGAPALIFLIIGSLMIILDFKPRATQDRLPEPIIVVVPMVFHGFAIFAGIGTGIFIKLPVLAVIEGAMLLLDISIHLSPWWLRVRSLESSP